MTDQTVNFRDICNSFSAPKVTAMKNKILKSFERRDIFEAAQGLNIAEKNSYTVERARVLKASTACAMFFLALDVEPSAVIERQVAHNAMFNAKALKKVTELALMSVSIEAQPKVERVLKAFIACALVATARGYDTITNAINARFLNSDDLKHVIADSDLLDNLNELRATHMSSGALTQSSQARNVLDVLGLGAIATVDKSRDAIRIDASHAFFAKFRSHYMK